MRELVTNTAQGLIDDWRLSHAGDSAANAPKRARDGIEPGSFLAGLLAARSRETGDKLSDSMVVAQAQLFILAGCAALKGRRFWPLVLW